MTLSVSKEILRDLIGFPTISTDPNLDLIEYLENRLNHVGARCFTTRDPGGTKGNLFATIGPDEPGGIMLSGHTDVVPVADQDWSFDPFQMTEVDGLLYGRGACDMKGFIATAVAMVEALDISRLNRPIHLAFTHDEESGCFGAQQLVAELEERDVRPDIAIIGEPTNMRIIEGHKGCFEYKTRFTGLEGHGSAPDVGVNAAEYAVRYVMRLLELREVLKSRTPAGSKFDPPWSTINVGKISGGVAHNVIVGKAEVDWEMRPVQAADAEFVKHALKEYTDEHIIPAMRAVHADANVSTEIIAEIVGLDPMDENDARDLVAELTGGNSVDLVAFGTEAGLFQTLGTHIVVCGPGSIEQAHKPDEFVAIEQLEQSCAMLENLARKVTT